MSRTITVPPEKIKTTECDVCHRTVSYAVLYESWPHLYCTRCNNVYHEKIKQRNYKQILTNWGRRKKMNLVESQAPLCECGGLFLFTAHPNCPYCNQPILFTKHLPDSKERLLHDELIVLNGSKEYMNDGTSCQYVFSASGAA